MNYKKIAETMKKMLVEQYEEIICINETTFFQRGENGGDALAPIVTAFTTEGIWELRLYNDPNEAYLRANPNDEIKSLELFHGYEEDDELEYMGCWTVVNGEVMKK